MLKKLLSTVLSLTTAASLLTMFPEKAECTVKAPYLLNAEKADFEMNRITSKDYFKAKSLIAEYLNAVNVYKDIEKEIENTSNPIRKMRLQLELEKQGFITYSFAYEAATCLGIDMENPSEWQFSRSSTLSGHINTVWGDLDFDFSSYIDINTKDEADTEPEEYGDEIIVLNGKYDAKTNTIQMNWLDTIKADEYNLYESDDGDKYTLIDTVSKSVYSYEIKDEFKEKYFKVTAITTDDKTISSTPLHIIRTEDGYGIEYKDSDNDGLQDSYEIYIGTDPKNKDTDDDRLTDGFEVNQSHTDPLKPDSNDNDITDDMEDPDSDGLDNYEEMINLTSPTVADTDKDDLSDGDEINVYKTDPLNPDTDGDGVLDGDEVAFKLDPNNASDGSTPIHQVVSEEALEVNKFNEDFSVSLELDASNNVNRYIKSDVSEYSGMLLENRSIIGTPICITYDAGNITEGDVKFQFSEEFINNSVDYYPEVDLGIERYGVMVYDDEINTMVPVDCKYDNENNCIYVSAVELGDFIIIDFESLLYDLGYSPDEVIGAIEVMTETDDDDESIEDDAEVLDTSAAEEETKTADETESDVKADTETDGSSEKEDSETKISESIAAYKADLIYDEMTEEEVSALSDAIEEELAAKTSISTRKMAPPVTRAARQIDLVLVVDVTGSMGDEINLVKRNLTNLVNKLRDDGITLYASVIDFGDITIGEETHSSGDFQSSITGIQSAIDALSLGYGGDEPETDIDGLGMANTLSYRSSASKYLFLITDATYKIDNNYGITSLADIADKLKAKDIKSSVITRTDLYSTYSDLYTTTNGITIDISKDFCDEMYNFMLTATPKESVVIANTLVTGSFAEPLVKGGMCDTDGDKLTDSDEVDWDFIKEETDAAGYSTYSYYTWEELCNKEKWTSPVTYTKPYSGGKKSPLYSLLKNTKVIPATSNPFSKDTDNDYYNDNIDPDKLKSNPMYVYDPNLNDDGFPNGVTPVKNTEDHYTDGRFIIEDNKSKYGFTRRINQTANFSLTPEKPSFYKITVAGENAVVSVRDWYGDTVDPIDGEYFLDQISEYTITTYARSDFAPEYEVYIQQDNWKYVPDGCVIMSDLCGEDGLDWRYNYCQYVLPDSRIRGNDEITALDWSISSTSGFQDNYKAIFKDYFLADKTQNTDANDYVSYAAAAAGIVSLILPPPLSAIIGVAATVVGGTTSVISFNYKMSDRAYNSMKTEFIDSLTNLISDDNYNMTITRYNMYYPDGEYSLTAEELPGTFPYVKKSMGCYPLIISTDIHFIECN